MTGAVVLTFLAAGAVGCSNSGGGGASSASETPSTPAAATGSAGASATAKPTGAASRAAEALASASAAADRKLAEIKNGVRAKNDVKLGTPSTDNTGHATVGVVAKNTAGSQKSFAVKVDFKDKSGNTLDTVVVTVKDVAAGAEGKATARSTQRLSGVTKTDVGNALRY